MVMRLLQAAAVVLSLLAPCAANAADDASVAAGLSPAVAEVESGGSWSQGGQSGFYRSVVVMAAGQGGFVAHLYVQWLSLPSGNGLPGIVKSVPVKEVNDRNLPFASIDLTGDDKDNAVTFVVSSTDAQNKDIALYVKATAPGSYSMEKNAPKPPAGAPQ